MYFSNVTEQGLPIDYYILDLEFGSTRAEKSEQDVPLEIALVQYHLGQQKHKQFLKFCYDGKYDDHSILRGLQHSNLPFSKYKEQGTFDVVIRDFLKYFNPEYPIGGWNVKGDLKVLNYYINYHCNNNKLLNTRVNYFNIDYYLKLLGDLNGIKLEQAGRLYGFDTSKMHHAINDVRLTHNIFEQVRHIVHDNPQSKTVFANHKLHDIDLKQNIILNQNTATSNEQNNTNFNIPIPKPTDTNNNLIAQQLYKAQQLKRKISITDLNKHLLNPENLHIRSKKSFNYTFLGTSESELYNNRKTIMANIAKKMCKTLICRNSLKNADFAVFVDSNKEWQQTDNNNLFTPKETDALNKQIPILSLEDLQNIVN